jgi:hypothetical protein
MIAEILSENMTGCYEEPFSVKINDETRGRKASLRAIGLAVLVNRHVRRTKRYKMGAKVVEK